jgi:hypothetical protein
MKTKLSTTPTSPFHIKSIIHTVMVKVIEQSQVTPPPGSLPSPTTKVLNIGRGHGRGRIKDFAISAVMAVALRIMIVTEKS